MECKKPSWLGESDEEEEENADEDEESQEESVVERPEPQEDRRLARLRALKEQSGDRTAALGQYPQYHALSHRLIACCRCLYFFSTPKALPG